MVQVGRLHAVVELLDVGHQLVCHRIAVGLQAGHPQVLLQPVEAGPLLTRFQIRLAQVDAGIEIVGERLGDRFDAFVIGARDRELSLGRVDVTLLDRVDENLSGRDQRVGLAVHVALVAFGRLLELARFVDLDGVAGDLEVAADAVADHARLACRLVGTGFAELHDQLALQPGGDVLHLTHHPLSLAVDVELGDLGAVVGDDESVGTGCAFGARQVACGVGRGDGDLRGATLAVRVGLFRLLDFGSSSVPGPPALRWRWQGSTAASRG